jgi:hypothetical protein
MVELIRCVVVAAALVALAGCGGSGGSDAGRSATTSTREAGPSTTVAGSSQAEVATTTEPLDETGVEKELTSSDGWKYRVTIYPAGSASPDPSPGECIQTAPPGSTNLTVRMEITNLLQDRAAPWPELGTALNLDATGSAVVPGADTIEKAPFSNLEIFPTGPDARCLLAAGMSPGIGVDPQEIGAGETKNFTITAGPLSSPEPDGISLVLRAFGQAGGDSMGRVDWAVPLT